MNLRSNIHRHLRPRNTTPGRDLEEKIGEGKILVASWIIGGQLIITLITN
jgi:hypothetical protein